MRFLLVNPYCPLSEGPTPPLGIAFVAAALERAGVEVEVLDLVTAPYDKEHFAELLGRFRPHIVGSTAVTMTFNNAKTVIRDAKHIDPDVLTVMGGPHVTFSVHETFADLPELDLIVRGEGEATICELVQQAEGDRDWSKVQGLAYRNGAEIRVTENRPLLDVNTLPPPARHLLPLGRYRALNMPISLTTSRGCPFPCIFCVGSKMVGSKIRYRDTQSVVDEMEYLNGLGFHQLNVADDLFTGKRTHALAVCDEILRRGLKIKWSCFSRVDTLTLELAKRMKEAGCATVSFGVETANVDMLATVKKGVKLPDVVSAIKMCTEAGIEPHVSFILGLPGETPETLEETLAFGNEIGELGALYGFHLLAPFPGTAVRDQNDAYDLTILSDDWSEYHANHAIVETSGASQKMLNDIIGQWDQAFKEKLDSGDLPGMDNLRRILVYHRLMMTRAVEQLGSWNNGSEPISDENALRMLTSKVYDRTDRDEEATYVILEYAVDHGHLGYEQEHGQVRWAWRDRL